MQNGLDSDFTTAQADLTTLLGVISSTERTILPTHKDLIRLKAHNAKEAADNSITKCSAATTDLTNWDPGIDVNDEFYKYTGSRLPSWHS